MSIEQTNDGGYILTGLTTSVNGDVTSNHGSGDYWVIRLSGEGIIEWQKTYGSAALTCIKATKDYRRMPL